MGSSLIFALCVAGLALLVFGERLGLPASMAAFGVIGILGFMMLGLSLASTTSRLRVFLHTRSGSALWGGACASALLFVVVLSVAIQPDTIGIAGSCAFLSGVFAVMLLAPAQIAEGNGGRRDAALMIAILTALAALHFAVTLWPHVLHEVSAATGWDAGVARITVLLLAGLPAILGGLEGLMRISGRILLLCAFLCLLPFGIEWARQFTPGTNLSFLPDMIREVTAQPLPRPSDLKASVLDLMRAPTLILTGALAGLTLRMTNPALPLRRQRFFAPLLGLAIAASFVVVAWQTHAYLDGVLLPALARLSPADWPLFIFDPSLQGWLRICGRVPRDAVDIAQACGSSTSPALAQFVIERQLALPAIAASAGWPLLLGTVWSLAIPLFLVLGLGLLVHAAASGISENLLFHFLHPRALRAWRLAMARAVALAILASLYLYPLAGPLPDARLMRTLAIGIVILLATSIVSIWLRSMVAALLRLRKPPLTAGAS